MYIYIYSSRHGEYEKHLSSQRALTADSDQDTENHHLRAKQQVEMWGFLNGGSS